MIHKCIIETKWKVETVPCGQICFVTLDCFQTQEVNGSDEGLTLETSAFLPFTVVNLRFQLSC